MSRKIAAIVVTFNRKATLAKCLESLLSQTVPLERIYVVDNCSGDGTGELFKPGGLFDREQIAYHRLPDNVGGAGGFNLGLGRAASGCPADWFWLVDDDVAAMPDCLSELLKYADQSECLHPRKIQQNGVEHAWEQFLNVSTARFTSIPNLSFRNGKPVCFVNYGCFEGMLVSRRIVEAIGLPDAKYFISFDDTLYGFKASLHTSVAYVRDAVLHKTLPESPPAPWKVYYQTRNRYYFFADCMNFLNIRVPRIDLFVFHFLRFTELLLTMRLGFAFVGPALRGAMDGWTYMRRARRRATEGRASGGYG